MLLLTTDKANKLDKYIINSLGISRDILIEHAGIAVAKKCDSLIKKNKRKNTADDAFCENGTSFYIDVFFGKGMNGLDALVCARCLFAFGYKVRIWNVFPENKDTHETSNWQLKACLNMGIPMFYLEDYCCKEDNKYNVTDCANSKRESEFEEICINSHDNKHENIFLNNQEFKTSKKNTERFNVICKEKLKVICADSLELENEFNVKIDRNSIHINNIVIDGIFGTGFKISRQLSPEILDLFTKINNCKSFGSKIISIDVPSGIEADTGLAMRNCVKADLTITFMSLKVGLLSYPAREFAGDIVLDRIGIKKEIIENFISSSNNDISEKSRLFYSLDLNLAKSLLLPRPVDGYKGTFGRISLVGGSKGMAGSICLSARSAMRCGVGLVYLKVPENIFPECLKVVPEALISSEDKVIYEERDATLIGPGMDMEENNINILWDLLLNSKNLVLDAQALNIISTNEKTASDILFKRKENKLPYPVMTPHSGEFNRLFPEFSQLSRVEAAIKASEKINAIIVLKGAGTIIATPDGKVFINTSGNSGMSKGGSGDVLAGMIVSFMGQGLINIDATCLAVYMHGLCGDIAAEQLGEHSALPSDFIKKIPEAFKKLLG